MAKENKRYYWFKLKEDFFLSKEIKLIRKMPSGSDMLIVLFKLQLHSLRNGGIIEIDGLCDSIEEELSILIDEDINLIKLSLVALNKFSLITFFNEKDIKMLLHEELIGSEAASTIRSRKSRENDKKIIEEKSKKALQCNTDATNCNIDIEIDIDIDKDIELDKEKYKDIYADTFAYYLSKNNLIKHKELTEPMKKAIDKAIKAYNLDFEYIKRIIDRHSEKVETTKEKGEFKTKVRTLSELLGQKKYNSQDFICVDYLDEVYKEIKQEINKNNESEEKYGF